MIRASFQKHFRLNFRITSNANSNSAMEYFCRVFFALKLSAAIFKVTRVCLMNEHIEKMERQNGVMGVCDVTKKVDGRGSVTKRISVYRSAKPF